MFFDWNRNGRIDPVDIGVSAALNSNNNYDTKEDPFENIWGKIVSMQGEKFFTVRGIPFTYKVIGNDLYPEHIASGHPTKSGFEKAYRLGKIDRPSQLSMLGIMGSSYVYAIMTDPRIIE